MMSPPTRPALSAGPPGASIESKVTPPSAVFQPSTPTYDFTTIGFKITPPIECRIGLIIAVNAAAPTKKTSKPTNTQLMPPIRRRFLGANAAESVPARLPPTNGWPALPKLVPRRNPQLRQKRNSDGIVEWQFEQTITVGPDEACGISEFSDIGDSPFAGLSKNIRHFYTAN